MTTSKGMKQMTETFNQHSINEEEQTDLQQLIERLKPLHIILSQNSYIKDTTSRLKRIIDDANSQPIVLFVGKERVGKTTLINGLIGRNLLEDSPLEPTSVNTFLKYGEEECIKAVFLDGMVATFDISKLELLTVSTTESAQIIREHIDFLEVYIQHDLLKKMTIVDSVSLEVGANNTAYISYSLLQRADEVFWILRGDSAATEAEIKLLHKLHSFGKNIHLVVNGIDKMEESVETFIDAELTRYGSYISEVVAVSVLQALEAGKTNDTQLLIDSRITELSQLLYQLVSNKEKKTRHVTELFIHWLELLRKEIELIPSREPYKSAFENVEQYHSNTDLEFTRQQRDMALITSYEEEYENVSKVFKEVQTLYQLLQKLSSDLYLRDPIVEKYEEMAGLYQKNVRDYRKLHVEYTMEYARLEKQFKKQTGNSFVFPLEESEQTPLVMERIETLNKMQAQCEEKFELIKKYEQSVCKKLYTAQNRLNELAAKRLETIINQVSELNLQRKRERTYIKSYANKLSEFNCIIEAQSFVKDAVQPFLLESTLPFSEQEKVHIRNTIECIMAVDLTHQSLYKQLNIAEPADLLAQMDFEMKYKLIGLSLTEADVVSELPEMPKEIKN